MADTNTIEFDPDAYLEQAHGAALAEAADFDPDAYLSSSVTAPTAATKDQGESSPYTTDLPIPTGFGGTMTINPSRVVQAVKNMGLEGGGATLGQAIGAPFEFAGGMHIGGALGGAGGNALAQFTTPGKKFSVGEMLAAGATGAVPGASLAKAGASQIFAQGAKYAGANLIGKGLQTGIDEGRLPTLKEGAIAAGAGALSAPLSKFLDRGTRAEVARVAAQQDAVRRETLKAGRGLGLVVPPAAVAPNAVTNTLQSLAGKAATAQEAILRNQPKINAAVRSEIGLPADAPLSPISINTARVAPNLVYEKIARSSPEAAGLLAEFKQASADANELYAAYRVSPIKDPSLLAKAKAAEIDADALKSGLGQVVSPALMKEFDSARTLLAKIGLADRATRVGDGNVDAKVFGDALEHGEKLTGNLLKLGRFQSAFGRYVKEAATTPPSAVDNLKMFARFGLGGGAGYAAGGPMGAIVGTLGMAAAEKGARSAILSKPFQSRFATPYYGPSLEDVPAGLARLGAESAGRDSNLDEPLSEEEMRRYEELKKKLRKDKK